MRKYKIQYKIRKYKSIKKLQNAKNKVLDKYKNDYRTKSVVIYS